MWQALDALPDSTYDPSTLVAIFLFARWEVVRQFSAMILSEAAILGSGMEKYLEFQGKVGAHAQDLFFYKGSFH
jgi:hypothetical protein